MFSVWTALCMEALVVFAVAGLLTHTLRRRLRSQADVTVDAERPMTAPASGA